MIEVFEIRQHHNLLLVRIVRQDGNITERFATPDMAPAVERWLTRGVIDISGELGDQGLVDVGPEDADFLAKLYDYLHKQFGESGTLRFHFSSE